MGMLMSHVPEVKVLLKIARLFSICTFEQLASSLQTILKHPTIRTMRLMGRYRPATALKVTKITHARIYTKMCCAFVTQIN